MDSVLITIIAANFVFRNQLSGHVLNAWTVKITQFAKIVISIHVLLMTSILISIAITNLLFISKRKINSLNMLNGKDNLKL